MSVVVELVDGGGAVDDVVEVGRAVVVVDDGFGALVVVLVDGFDVLVVGGFVVADVDVLELLDRDVVVVPSPQST